MIAIIKIAEVCSDTNIGGAGICVVTLMKELDRSKFEPVVILPVNSLLKDKVEETGTRVIEVDGIADKSLDFPTIKKLKAIFKTEKPEIVHTHACMSARIAAKALRIKTVYTRHTVYEPPKRITHGMGKLINGIIGSATADAIIAVAGAAKDNLTDTGISEKKITVVINGVQAGRRREDTDEIKKSFGIKKDDKVISIIARLEEIKGHEYFIKAADLLKKRGKRAIFVIAGTGSREEELKELVSSLSLFDTILFPGFVKDVGALLSISDIQVNASTAEATSLSLLEGMSLGIPAVVTDAGGNPDVITNGENGYVVPMKDPAALADKIEKLLDDPKLYENMSKKAAEIFSQKFTATVMTRNTEKVYLGMLNNQER